MEIATRPPELGRDLFGDDGLDPYCEQPGTAWLMYLALVSTYDKTTTWYFLFNHMSQQVFDREGIVATLSEGV